MVTVAGKVLLDLLSPRTRGWLSGLAQRRSYADGELIHSRGDPVESMEVVVRGKVRLSRYHANGSHTFVSTVHAGQHFGDILLFDSRRRRTHHAVAAGEVEIDHFDRIAFDRMLTNHEVLLALYAITASRLGAAMSMNDDLRALPREVHLAKLLLHQWRLGGRPAAIECVQEDLAGMLGVSQMTLSKALASLRAQGLVKTGYRKVALPDPERLEAWLAERAPG